MNIYLIGRKELSPSSKNILVKYGQVIELTSGNKEFSSYSQLFEDPEEKIIGVAPGVLEWKMPVDDIKSIKNLKGICTKSAWAHYINLNYCRENNIVVCNTPGANSQSVAEYAIWMILSLSRLLPIQMQENFTASYDESHQQVEIEGKTLGIIGLGNIGKRVAKMGKGLGMKVIYWSQTTRDDNYKYVSLNQLLKTADYIVNCVEICAATKNLLDRSKLVLMKPTSYFISVFGGMNWGPEDDKYLLQMVKTKKLAGFAVENEHNGKLEFSIPKGNIFIPGAYAWYTQEALARTEQMWIDSMVGVIKNKCTNKVN